MSLFDSGYRADYACKPFNSNTANYSMWIGNTNAGTVAVNSSTKVIKNNTSSSICDCLWVSFNINTKIVTKDYSFTGSFSAGTIGTRGDQKTTTVASPYSGYTIIGVFITNIGDSTAAHVQAFYYNGSIYCNFYRAQAAAMSSNNVTVRAVFLK